MSGRTKVQLEPQEMKLIENLAEKDGVTPDIEFEAAVLAYLKTHDSKLYEEAEEHATPEALELLRRFEDRKGTKDLAEARKIIELCKIEDGEWWIEKVHGFYAVLKGGKVTVPKEIIEKLKLEEDRFVKLTIDTA